MNNSIIQCYFMMKMNTPQIGESVFIYIKGGRRGGGVLRMKVRGWVDILICKMFCQTTLGLPGGLGFAMTLKCSQRIKCNKTSPM